MVGRQNTPKHTPHALNRIPALWQRPMTVHRTQQHSTHDSAVDANNFQTHCAFVRAHHGHRERERKAPEKKHTRTPHAARRSHTRKQTTCVPVTSKLFTLCKHAQARVSIHTHTPTHSLAHQQTDEYTYIDVYYTYTGCTRKVGLNFTFPLCCHRHAAAAAAVAHR